MEDASFIRHKIYEFIDRKPEYTVLLLYFNWIIITKMVSFNVQSTSNPGGFQPVERTENVKKWVIAFVEVWGYPEVQDTYEMQKLVEQGCPVIRISNYREIESKLEEI